MFNKIENEEEKRKVIDNIMTWKWADDKFKAEKTKKTNIYRTDDGYILLINNAKDYSISRTIYYDDTLPCPHTDLETFKNYNLGLNCQSYFGKEFEQYQFMICEQYQGRHDVVEIRATRYYYDFENLKLQNFAIRELTQEEKEQYKTILEEITQNYIVRLEKYYKRYSNKITTYGYWANR